MSKGRLEAFSDGVFAVIITIMVLNMKVPRGTDLQALKSVVPVFLCYVLSYLYVGIYWNNHHHLLHASERVTGGILWANLILLFCLSLAPFTTAWDGREQLCAASGGDIRSDAAFCRNRIFCPDQELDRAPREELSSGDVNWE